MRANPWTNESIARFWNEHAGGNEADYFSNQVGAGIVHLLSLKGLVRRKTRVLDYGCGPGWLLAEFLARGADCAGVDTSPNSISMAARVLAPAVEKADLAVLNGSRAPFPEGSFALVTCVETIEHIPDDPALDGLIGDVHRLLIPGGVILLTTPHDEDLRSQFTYCPFCDTRFHPMQHVRSFTIGQVQGLLRRNGFTIDFCEPISLTAIQHAASPPKLPNWKHISPYMIVNGIRLRLIRRSLKRLIVPGRHLVAIARKP